MFRKLLGPWRSPPGASATGVGRRRRSLAAALLLLCSAPAAGATCDQVVAAIHGLDASKSEELKPTPGGPSYAQLYGGCDGSDTFAGLRLPAYHGIRVRCSTDRNAVAFVRRFRDRTIVFESKLGVDADGSPEASGASRSRTDQAATSLRYRDRTSVDAEQVPFVVVPMTTPDGAISFQKDSGVRLGDLAVVVHGGRCSMGIVADTGPWFRLGEASLRVHEDLGNGQCAKPGEQPCRRLRGGGGGIGIASHVTTIVFPGSRPPVIESGTVREVAARMASERLDRFLADFAN